MPGAGSDFESTAAAAEEAGAALAAGRSGRGTSAERGGTGSRWMAQMNLKKRSSKHEKQ